jgi:hypothetical protein
MKLDMLRILGIILRQFWCITKKKQGKWTKKLDAFPGYAIIAQSIQTEGHRDD